LVITMSRPERRNAVDGELSRGVAAALDRLDSDPGLAVGVLVGAGGTFCAGMDLKAFLAGDQPVDPDRGFGGIVGRPPEKPLCAAVEGYALAGGLEIMLACDLVVAARDAEFGLPEVKRGLTPGGGGVLRLAQRIPPAVALDILLTGDFFSAERAFELGLVTRLAEPGSALDDALDLAQRIAANAPLAVRTTKRLATNVNAASADEWDRHLAAALALMKSDDAAEGARAFAERRSPRWSGR